MQRPAQGTKLVVWLVTTSPGYQQQFSWPCYEQAYRAPGATHMMRGHMGGGDAA